MWSRLAVIVAVTVLGASGTAVPPPVLAQGQAPQANHVGPGKIAVVDVQRVLARSAAGVAAREQLEREKAAMQKELDGKRQELEKLKDELDKKSQLMTADARKEKQEVFDRKRRDAARLVDDYQKELEKKEQGLLQKVLQDVSGVIDRMGKQRNYYLIVEKSRGGVIYLTAEADITDEVIRAYDQESAAKGKK
jgi:outer membrane protein